LHQAAFLIVNKGKIGASAEGLIGGGWALIFFLTRIVTIPWLLLRYQEAILTSGCMNTADRVLGLVCPHCALYSDCARPW
jgi:hypothetical protein